MTKEQFLQTLRQKQLIPADQGLQDQDLHDLAIQQCFDLDNTHWFSKVVTGFGAWLSSWLLTGFFISSTLITGEKTYLFVGLLLIIGATVIRRKKNQTFSNQFTLSTALCGQALFIFGLYDNFLDSHFTAMLLTIIAINSVMIGVYPDKAHRFLSVCFAVSALVVLIYKEQNQWLLTYLTPLITIAANICFMSRNYVKWLPLRHATSAVAAGLFSSAIGLCLLSNIYLLPELVGDFEFYPAPGVSTVGITAILFFHWFRHRENTPPVTIAVIACLSIFAYLLLPAPGIALSAFIILTGHHSAHRGIMALGLIGYIAFFTAFFYSVSLSMLNKSSILISAGLFLLIVVFLYDTARKKQIKTSMGEKS